MPDQEPTYYDRVPYPGRAFGQSHPDRLATVASLYGMRPAPISRCRVLELGCGDGGNLIPMACQWLDSTFLGIDRNARAIDTGVRALAELGLRNIELRALDIMDVTADLGSFDYVIAHGVYSWVPPPVRTKVLDIFTTTLAPQGVGYISYNSYPGAYLVDLVRRMMLYHVRDEPDPRERITQSRALLTLLADASRDDEIYGLVLRTQLDRVRRKPDAVFLHDDLDEGASPFFLYEVVEDAARHGLQYLADATAPVVDLRGQPASVARVLERIPEHEQALREQYLDFLGGRGFRQTLLCHAGVELGRTVRPASVQNYWIAACVESAADQTDVFGPQVVELRTPEGTLSTDHRLSKAALLRLGEIWPRAVTFGELMDQALEKLGLAADAIRANLDDEADALSTVLFRGFAARQVHLHQCPPRLTTTISACPEASPVARRQARTDSVVTNLLHGSVSLEDELVRRFLPLVDGSRNIDQLVSDLNAAVIGHGDDEGGRPALTRESVERNLVLLARLGLLVA